ncbi:MAG: ATP synthase F1 subunit gamma [Bdellovibrio sp.]|nr:ATP synthase F1 subunit gamma [Bdellovibrio sp.]
MANLKEIRIRIDSTKNTQQITKAMKMVSAAKLRKAQHQIQNMRPYAVTLKGVIADIAATQKVSHPLMVKKANPKTVLLVVLTSDRGLCGGFNSGITKFADRYIAENKTRFEKIDFVFIGKRGIDYFARKGVKAVENFTKLDKDISFGFAHTIAGNLIAQFEKGHYDEIRLIYNEFKSAISQKVVCETILPVDIDVNSFNTGDTKIAADMIFDPSPELIIEDLLKKNFNLQVFRAMAESVASEHGARMTAMENASNNARDMINKLTLNYNKARQEKITTELTEIVSGAESLK